MESSRENSQGVWQLRPGSWLLEEEDREMVRTQGLAALRERDLYADQREDSFLLGAPSEQRADQELVRRWGYGEARPRNVELISAEALARRLESLWADALGEPSPEQLERWVRQGGLAARGACRFLSGMGLPTFHRALARGTLGVAGPLGVVLHNDVLAVLSGEELMEERARWWFNQGVLGVLMRWLRGGAQLLEQQGVTTEGLFLEEGWPEQIVRAALWDRHEFGRFLRDLVEADITAAVLEVGLPALTTGMGVGADLGDLLLRPWWALAARAQGGAEQIHLLCAMARRLEWPGGQHPMLSFELSTDDHELILGWLLEHRCRFTTGRWEFSPAWAFIPVIEQIFWLHGLMESEELGYQEHNGTASGYAFELITEHQADRPSRWIPNAPRVNELDWRIREVILPVVEGMASELADLYQGHSELNESGERWAKAFYPWEEDREGYAASEIRMAEVLPVAIDLLEAEGWEPGSADQERAEGFIEGLGMLLEQEGLAYWCAAQGWQETLGLNELLAMAQKP